MKIVFAGAVVAFAAFFHGPAFAADMSVKARPSAVEATRSWTGFYIGLGAGYGLSDTRSENLLFPTGAFLNDNGNFGGRGFVGRVFGGFDYQLSQNWLVGVLADGNWTNIRGSALNVNASAPAGGTAPFDARQFWAVGGRAGYLVNPMTLAYINGGYTEAEFRGGGFVDSVTAASVDLNRPNTTYRGYFLGGGVEYSFAPGWFAKTEYRYADYRAENTSLVITSTGAPSNTIERNQPVVHTVVGGISYKLNWGR